MSCVGSAHDGSYQIHSWIIIDKYGHRLSKSKLERQPRAKMVVGFQLTEKRQLMNNHPNLNSSLFLDFPT